MVGIITLTTDFGTRDGYVAAMKGVMLGLAPGVTLVDVTHEVAPQDVWEGAFVLAQVAGFFPPGTVHVAVVDPGVGTARAGIVIETDKAMFVGPDNGVLTLAAPAGRAFRIEDVSLFLAPVSATFHGRDVFAPIAARLAQGLPVPQVGPPHKPKRLVWRKDPAVVAVDRFGNLILSFGEVPPQAQAIDVDGLGRAPLRQTYSDVAPGELVAYVGSSGLLEVAVRNGSAVSRMEGDPRGRKVFVVI